MDNIGVLVTLTLDNKQFNTELNKASEGLEQIRKNGLGLSQNLGSGKTGATTSMQKLVSGAKNFIGALLTVRGIWFGIRKSMSVYMAQNEELSDKLQSFWYGVGSAFAPLAEILIDTLGKALGYFDVFIKSLGFAGVDMINLNKNAKETQKTLAGFDEINNLSDNTKQIANILDGVVLNEKAVEIIYTIGGTISKMFPNTDDLDVEGFKSNVTDAIAGLLGGVAGAYLGAKTSGVLGAITGLVIGLTMFGNFTIDEKKTLATITAGVVGLGLFLKTKIGLNMVKYLGFKLSTSVVGQSFISFAAGLGITWTFNNIFNKAMEMFGLSDATKSLLAKIVGALELIIGVFLIASGNPALAALGIGIALGGLIEINWGFKNSFDKDSIEVPDTTIKGGESLQEQIKSEYTAQKLTGKYVNDQYGDNASGLIYQANSFDASKLDAFTGISGIDDSYVTNNNKEVVNKLNEVVDAIKDTSNKKVIITQDSIGQATQNYNNRQSRILGVSKL